MIKSSHHIRQATGRDYDQLCVLFDELDTFHRIARPDLFFQPAGAARERDYVSKLIAGPNSAILVASGEMGAAQPLDGFATLVIHHIPAGIVTRERRFIEIGNFDVRSNAQRRGIGGALMNHALLWARSHNITSVELGVHEFNTGAIAFYEAVGFATSRRRMALDLG